VTVDAIVAAADADAAHARNRRPPATQDNRAGDRHRG
jgi:hypothetical protein